MILSKKVNEKICSFIREYVRNLDLRVQVHPGELWISKHSTRSRLSNFLFMPCWFGTFIFEFRIRSDRILKFKVRISSNQIFLIFEKFGSGKIFNVSNFLGNLLQTTISSEFTTFFSPTSNPRELCCAITSPFWRLLPP